MGARRKRAVPIWERSLLTIEEAADYTGIGINRLRIFAQTPHNDMVFYVGTQRMIKRKSWKSISIELYLCRNRHCASGTYYNSSNSALYLLILFFINH